MIYPVHIGRSLSPHSIFNNVLLGFCWWSKYYIDTRLPFGLASAAMACQRIINTVAFMFESLSLSLINYLVDMASAKRRLHDAISASFQLKQLYQT